MRPALVASVLALLVSACSSDEPGLSPRAADGSMAGGDGAAGFDGGMTTPPPRTKNAFVLMTGLFRQGTLTNLSFANFLAEAGERCATKVAGGCRLVDCGLPGPLPGGASAGKLTVRAGSGHFLATSPRVDGIYPPAVDSTGVWGAGDPLTFEATGGEVPAFSQALVAPARIPLVKPAPTGALPLPRGRDLALTWGATAGQATAVISQTPPDDLFASTRIFCDFDATKGAGTVPSALLQALRVTGGEVPPAVVDFGGSTSVDVSPGGYSIRVVALHASSFEANVE